MEIDIAGQEERDRLLEKMRTKPDKLFITKISTNDPSYDESVPKAEFDF
jgi:hypothetical protein